jgi:anti-anti-sigma regulatory factor
VTLGHLHNAVETLAELGPRILVIDLSGLNFLSASGARLLLAANKRLGANRLAVVITPGHIAGKTTHIVDSDQELSVYETLREALAATGM